MIKQFILYPLAIVVLISIPVAIYRWYYSVRIQKILSFTAGRYHAWVQSNYGRIRKPINKLPPKMVKEFVEAQNGKS